MRSKQLTFVYWLWILKWKNCQLAQNIRNCYWKPNSVLGISFIQIEVNKKERKSKIIKAAISICLNCITSAITCFLANKPEKKKWEIIWLNISCGRTECFPSRDTLSVAIAYLCTKFIFGPLFSYVYSWFYGHGNLLLVVQCFMHMSEGDRTHGPIQHRHTQKHSAIVRRFIDHFWAI